MPGRTPTTTITAEFGAYNVHKSMRSGLDWKGCVKNMMLCLFGVIAGSPGPLTSEPLVYSQAGLHTYIHILARSLSPIRYGLEKEEI